MAGLAPGVFSIAISARHNMGEPACIEAIEYHSVNSQPEPTPNRQQHAPSYVLGATGRHSVYSGLTSPLL